VPALEDQPFSAPVVSSGVAFDGAVWNVRRERFEYGEHELVREFVDHPGAVAVLAVDDQERVLLIRQYRHPVRMRELELPAGLLDVEGEDPLAAAKRELAEEADLQASEWALLTDFFTSPGSNSEAIRVYLARGLGATPAFERTAEEADLELHWVTLDDAVDAVLERRIGNGIACIALLAANALRGRGWAGLDSADAAWPQHPQLRD
jgi:8-oxo-dGTP pyrophosphatase MutT (NUDIX family)